MKTKYTNKTHELKQIRFADGTSVFLRRGETHISDKDVKKMADGIKTAEVRPSKRKAMDIQEAE